MLTRAFRLSCGALHPLRRGLTYACPRDLLEVRVGDRKCVCCLCMCFMLPSSGR